MEADIPGTGFDRPQLESPEDHEAILHPLREAADRVGEEVENFAKALDEYNPLRATTDNERYDMTIALVGKYSSIAHHTLKRLREHHAAGRKRQEGRIWRQNFKGLKIAQDDDEMEEDDEQFSNLKTTPEDLETWEEESQTWDLLQRLIDLRSPPPGLEKTGKRNGSPSGRIHRYSTENEVWEDFLESDDLALERKTVLQWLKHTADESREDIDVLVQDLQQNAERGDIIAHGWLHTKSAVKNQKRLHVWPHPMDPASAEVQRVHWNSAGTEPLVTQLDPDAMTRQDRKLESQDEYFERAIWLGCYEMLRRGKSLAEIKEWCKDRTQVWRAVSLSGLPNEQAQGDDDNGDPASGGLWRRMCFALARKGGGDEYERAVYGLLCGDISSVEPVCQSWDDFVFVHYNALLQTQFDKYLQLHYPERTMSINNPTFGIFDAVQFHGDSETAGQKLIESLKTDRRTAIETLRPIKSIQGALISNQFRHFVHQQGLAAAKLGNKKGLSNLIPWTDEEPENQDLSTYISLEDHDSLRVVAHILLIYISLGLDMGGPTEHSIIENVLVEYISFLRLAGKEELIPLYCSQLSGDRKYATLSRTLIDITDPSQRQTQIMLIEKLGLDVQKFVSYQTRYLFKDYEDKERGYPATGNFHLLEKAPSEGRLGLRVRRDFMGDDPDAIDKPDLLLIRSLEWYLLVDGLWSETFLVGTMLYLRFFSMFSPAIILLSLTFCRAHAAVCSPNVSFENSKFKHLQI
jgi:nuclear pore complex protein Nup107